MALETGWSEGHSSDGEVIRVFVPPLLPLSYRIDKEHAVPPAPAVQAAIEGAGLLAADDHDLPAASRRARRAGSTLVRDARFREGSSKRTTGCARCAGLTSGSSKEPTSTRSPRRPRMTSLGTGWRFARTIISLSTSTSSAWISSRPRSCCMKTSSTRFPRAQPWEAFVGGTYKRLAAPKDQAARPRAEMFRMRYDFYVDCYHWMTTA